MAARADSARSSNVYQLFILVLTVLSLSMMVLLLLPLNDATHELLLAYDNSICVIFLVDFGISLKRAVDKRDYLIEQRGWLDLLGSIPALGVFNLTALFRLARLSRSTRIVRIMQRQNGKQLVEDVINNRGQYAAAVTLLLAFIVLIVASVLELFFEAASAEANITTGGDALWWTIVTITTVGYGDKYPLTAGGRVTAVFVMIAGVGIIGSLAGILSSILVPPPTPADSVSSPSIERELAAVRSELAAVRSELAAVREALARLGSSPR